MKEVIVSMCMFAFALAAAPGDTAAQALNRSDIAVEDTWNVADLFASDAEWRAARDQLAGEMKKITQFKGTLAASPTALLECLTFHSDIDKKFARLYVYASLKSDEDTRNADNLALTQEIAQLGTEYQSIAAFFEPEVVAIDKSTIDKFIAAEAGLKDYRMYLGDLQRQKAHTLSEPEEKILAESGLLARAPGSIYRIFTDAELPYPTVTLSDGQSVRLDRAAYSKYRASENRDDRRAVFQAFWKAFGAFEGTLGADLDANVKRNMFYARTRRYESSLASALDRNNIPTDVYRSLVKNVNDNLDSFHRYLRLKQRMLGVDHLEYSDVYAPVVKGVELEYTIDEAKKLVLSAMEPLGKDYTSVLNEAFKNRWVDVYPTTGKRSGAYSEGAVYDVHPYVLLNYNGQYDDVSTLAHEMGHAMQSYHSNRTQPYPMADYSIFVAEVASTFNEALLIHKVLDGADDETRLSLLMNYLEGVRVTLFRQTQLAEFELAVHEMAERGEPLTGEALTKVYGDIIRRYYGNDEGVCKIDDLYAVEWAYIPHFYYNFYVFQYATSFTASTALAEKVLAGEKGAVDRYLQFLSAGSSDYPINELKAAGVDMTTSEPFEKTMRAINRTMDEIEAILDRRNS